MAEPKTRTEVIAISNAAADAAGIPRLLVLACGIAEGNLRWDARRPTDPSRDADYWPDVSVGVWQQTIRWAAEHLKAASKAGRDPAAFPGAGTIAAIGEAYLDAEYAAEVASAQLKAKWDGRADDAGFLRAMYLYNWPAGGGKPFSAQHEANYKRGLAEAKTILGGAVPAAPIKLSEVLARMRSMTGAPYVFGGNAPGSPDCSEAVSYAYGGKVPGYTDAIFPVTERVDGKDVAPGDIVLYEYDDPSQPGVRFPHVAIYLDDARVIDARYGYTLGERPQLPRTKATRYYRRLPGVVVDTAAGTSPMPAPAPTPPPAADPLAPWINAVAYLGDDVADRVAHRAELLRSEADELDAIAAELRRVRVERAGPRP